MGISAFQFYKDLKKLSEAADEYEFALAKIINSPELYLSLND